MRVLLSAYACEPNRGSEQGIGWNWCRELARQGHEVHVLTRANNRELIERSLPTGEPAPIFHYYDLPDVIRQFKRGSRGVHAYYALWQAGIVGVAKALDKRLNFDAIHHLTFGVVRQPTHLWKVGKPLLIGPVGGAESAPKALRAGLSSISKAKEFARDLANYAAKLDPVSKNAYRRAALTLCKTQESLEWVRSVSQRPAEVALEVGFKSASAAVRPPNEKGALSILFAGRLIYWKGADLAIEAFAEYVRAFPSARLSIAGDGPEAARLQALIEKLGIAKSVSWLGWVDQSELFRLYRTSDAFLFPSLHDSSGNVVLEALAAGTPVVCLDCGGPATIVGKESGLVVITANQTREQIIQALAGKLAELSRPDRLASAQLMANQRSAQFTWSTVVANAYRQFAAALSTPR